MAADGKRDPGRERFFDAPFFLTFAVMALFWGLFSGKFDPFHLSVGAISCAMVAAFSKTLLFPSPMRADLLFFWVRFIRYVPWLLYQIFLANLHLLYLVFHPRMMELIDPDIIEFQSTLKSDVARTTLANSITLTPGTITVNVGVLGRFSVHCIDEYSGKPLPGEMEKRIARIFGE